MKKLFTGFVLKIKPFASSKKGRVIICFSAAAICAAAAICTAFETGKMKVSKPLSGNKTAVVSSGKFPKEVKLDKTELTLKEGDTANLVVTVTPTGTLHSAVEWSSSDRKIATVYDGTVKAQSCGTAAISAVSDNGKKATCTVTVSGVADSTGVTSSKPVGKENSGDDRNVGTDGVSSASAGSFAPAGSSGTASNISGRKTGSSVSTGKSGKSGGSGSGSSSGRVNVQSGSKKSAGSSTSGGDAYSRYKKTVGDRHKTIGSDSISFEPASATVQISVDVTGAHKYLSDDYFTELNVKIYKNGSLFKSGYYGDIGDENTDSVVFGVSSYKKDGFYWSQPATYTVKCYAGTNLFQTITFSVNENGFA